MLTHPDRHAATCPVVYEVVRWAYLVLVRGKVRNRLIRIPAAFKCHIDCQCLTDFTLLLTHYRPRGSRVNALLEYRAPNTHRNHNHNHNLIRYFRNILIFCASVSRRLTETPPTVRDEKRARLTFVHNVKLMFWGN